MVCRVEQLKDQPIKFLLVVRLLHKNIDLLRRFITDQGKILPRRLTGVTAKEQRQLAKSIKQARILGFLQFLYKE